MKKLLILWLILAISFSALAETRDFSWEHQGRTCRLSLSYNKALYQKYAAMDMDIIIQTQIRLAKANVKISKTLDWQAEYWRQRLIISQERDNVAIQIVNQLRQLANQYGWHEALLAISFVRQAIDYDYNKFALNKKGVPGIKIRFPLMTVADKRGICSDKSLLLYAILQKMGYGVCLIYCQADCWPTMNHMACGIVSKNSWLYIETSGSSALGQVPKFKSDYSLTLLDDGCPAKLTFMLPTAGKNFIQ